MSVSRSTNDSDISLDNNVEALINNPLKDSSPGELDRQGDEFATETKASPTLCRKAARYAKDPERWRSLREDNGGPGLDPEEDAALERASTGTFWQEPKYLKFGVVNLAFSAIIQGWIQSSINGANQDWPGAFHLTDDENRLAGPPEIVRFAAVNAVMFLTASLCGCWLSDPLQEKRFPIQRNGHQIAALGRRGAIFLSCCLILASLVGSASTHTWYQLLGCRILLGIGLGAKASISPIFGAEISPSYLRGAFGMSWQVFDALGILLGFSANLILHRVGPSNWRFQLASPCLPTLLLMATIWTIPESPRWLLKQGRIAEAYRAMCFLRATPLQAAAEVLYANAQIQVEVQLVPKSISGVDGPSNPAEPVLLETAASDVEMVTPHETGSSTESITKRVLFREVVPKFRYHRRIWNLFRNKRTRRATVAAGIVMLCQQLCGINVLLFYSSTLFRNINEQNPDPQHALLMSWGFGCINFLFTIPAYWYIDSKGRRFLLLSTYPSMILCMIGASLSFLIAREPARYGVVGLFTILFVMAYSFGQGPVAFAYASEVFPLITREVGMSFAVFVNFLFAGILTFVVPLAQLNENRDTPYQETQAALLGAFAGLCLLALGLIFCYVPETSDACLSNKPGRMLYISLEDLNYIFGIPAQKHAEYQIGTTLPHYGRLLAWFPIGYLRGQARPQPPEGLVKWSRRRDAAASPPGSEPELPVTGVASASERSLPISATGSVAHAESLMYDSGLTRHVGSNSQSRRT